MILEWFGGRIGLSDVKDDGSLRVITDYLIRLKVNIIISSILLRRKFNSYNVFYKSMSLFQGVLTNFEIFLFIFNKVTLVLGHTIPDYFSDLIQS